VTWAHGNGLVHERAVSADGRSLGEAVSMGQTFATSPAVVGGPMSDFFVAFSDWPNATDFDIYGHLWGIRLYLPPVLR
jgi:hypothetical protein